MDTVFIEFFPLSSLMQLPHQQNGELLT